jgi:hypothetical protein
MAVRWCNKYYASTQRTEELCQMAAVSFRIAGYARNFSFVRDASVTAL